MQPVFDASGRIINIRHCELSARCCSREIEAQTGLWTKTASMGCHAYPSWATRCSPLAAAASSKARAEMMWQSLLKLRGLPDDTQFYCGHEYTDVMRRREFITVIGGAAAAWPLAARAQQPDRKRLVGVLIGYAETNAEVQTQVAAFRDRLRKLGWTEGSNIRLDTRWVTPGDTVSTRRSAKELVAIQPDLLVSNTTLTTAALLQQTRTIPSFSLALAIQSAAVLSRASRDLAATSPGPLFRSRRRLGSGCNC
jgi:hypothetical protein